MGHAAIPTGFYVYQLKDPRNGLPFYVGKGQRRRAWQHERAVRSGRATGNARKDAKIKEILAAGLEVDVWIVAEYDDELDALNHEYRLVDSDPTLTNIMEGGGIGRRLTLVELQRRSELRRKRFIEMRVQAKAMAIERKKQKFAAFVGQLRQGPGAERHKTEIDAWEERLASKRRRIPKHRKRAMQKRAAAAAASL